MTCNRDARDEKNCEIIKQSWDFIWVINHRFLLGVYLWTHLSWYQGYSALFWSHWLVSWGGDVWALSASSPSLLLISTGSWSAITDNIKVRPQQSSPGSIKPDQTALWYLLSVSHGVRGSRGINNIISDILMHIEGPSDSIYCVGWRDFIDGELKKRWLLYQHSTHSSSNGHDE